MTSIGILGVHGRMGRAIANAAAGAGASIAGGIDRDGQVHGDHQTLAALAAASDVLVDFTSPDALAGHLAAAVDAGTPIVIGTTGLTPGHHQAIDAAASAIPIVQTANTSLGINLLRALVEEAARRLGPDWDIEILEMHHRHKGDAPSGTALALGEAAARGRGTPLQAERGRDGTGLKRQPGSVGFASLRGGTVAGEHDVVFAGPDERLVLSHRADSRMIFARGALAAARFLVGKPAGLYSMRDVIDQA